MTHVQILTYAPAAFCLAVAIGATFLARKHSTLDLGLTLIACSIFTTIAYASLDDFGWQLMFEVMMAALIVHRALLSIRIDDACRATCGVIMLLAAIDVAFISVVSVRLAAFPGELRFYQHLVPWITNPIFLLQAALVARPGISDALALPAGRDRGLSDRALDRPGLSIDQDR